MTSCQTLPKQTFLQGAAVRALVTGGGGFLGGLIVKGLLEGGDEVRSFSRGSYPYLKRMGVETIVGDIRDGSAVEHACRGIDVVFHTAAIAGIWGPWQQFFEVNVVGTENVLVACQKQGVGRLVYTSSPSVTFDGGDQINADESVGYASKWLCHYPHTKAIAEQRVLAANQKEGLLTCALRPHLIWGPGDPHLIPRIIERARRGQLRRIGDGTNLIDTVFVENAAEAHIQVSKRLTLESPVAGRAYFISQGEPVNCWDWIDQILELAGLPPLERQMSFRLAWTIGAWMERAHRVFRIGSEPRMTRFLASQLAHSHYFNLDRARADFGYVPRVSLEEGMRRLAASF